MIGEYGLHATATFEALAQVHHLFEQISEPVAAQDLMLFETAVIEVVGNLIKHGRPPGEVPFDLRVEVAPDALVAEVDDWSAADTPYLHHEMPSAEDVSGRGLPLIWAVVDDFSVETRDGHHVWRLRRLRT